MKKIFYSLFIIAGFCFHHYAGLSQVNTYEYFNDQKTYVHGTGGSVLHFTDALQHADGIPIGFTFKLSNTAYTHIAISPSGVIKLGDGSVTLSTTDNSPLIAPLWIYTNPRDGYVSHYLSTNGRESILTIDWYQMHLSPNNTVSYKLRMYEKTGIIEFIYDSFSGQTPSNFNAFTGVNDGSSFMRVINGDPLRITKTDIGSFFTDIMKLSQQRLIFKPMRWYDFSEGDLMYADISFTPFDFTSALQHADGVPIGFDFNFYGQVYSHVSISASGRLKLGGPGISLSDNINTPMIAPMSIYSDPSGGTVKAGVYQGTQGHLLIVAWSNMHLQAQAGNTVSFEVILHEFSNIIEFRYGTFSGTFASNASARVGIDNDNSFVNVFGSSPYTASGIDGETEFTDFSNLSNKSFVFTPLAGVLARKTSTAPLTDVLKTATPIVNISTTNSLQNVQSLSLQKLYPNPALSNIRMDLSAQLRERVTILITDISGKTVSNSSADILPGANTINLNVANLPSGTYILKLTCTANCEFATKRFTKL